MTPALLLSFLPFRAALAVESGPSFPNGVAAIVSDIRDRMTSASLEHGDDADAVALRLGGPNPQCSATA